MKDSLPPMLGIMRKVDPTFRELPHQTDGRFVTQFQNAAGYKVEFLTPNRGSDEYNDKPARMPPLGGASALPIRYLDYLIDNPVRTVMLHKAGIPVLVPDPAHYAVHKLIVASLRSNDDNGLYKWGKDLFQASSLAAALDQTRQADDLGEAWAEAWERGPKWREEIGKGLFLMGDQARGEYQSIVTKGLANLKLNPADYGMHAGSADSPLP